MSTHPPLASAEAEAQRAASLRDAEAKALALFEEIASTIIRPGISEKALSDAIHELGAARHGVRTHWHKRLVRSGPNTLHPFVDSPPDREVGDDDILMIDLGPVFEQWEAHFGRTYVFGTDPRKLRLRDSLKPVWRAAKARFDAARLVDDGNSSSGGGMTGEELFNVAVEEAKLDGFVWGAEIAGHIVGMFPHERIPKNKITLYIARGNTKPMLQPGKDGFVRHWILEIHLRDPSGEFGGFYEQLLTC